jgi:hypothetical protein
MQVIVVLGVLGRDPLVAVLFLQALPVVDNLDNELWALFVRGLLLRAAHARITARGSSTVPSTVSSLMNRNSWPATVKRVPE